MIDLAREIVGALLLVGGAAFFLIGAVGVHRMPDLFTRIHAASLADTAGVGLVLVGLMVYGGLTLVTVKLALLLLFLMFMGPVATHALAAAALQAGLKPGGGKSETKPPVRKASAKPSGQPRRKGRGTAK